MQKFINSFMCVISGISLMTLKILGMPIIDFIQNRIYPGEIPTVGIIIFGIIYDIIALISLIGMIITIVFSVSLLKNVFKSYKNK